MCKDLVCDTFCYVKTSVKMTSSLEINYVLKPSLKHIAAVKSAVMLWNQHDVRVLTEKYFSSQRYLNDRAGTWPHDFRASMENYFSFFDSDLNDYKVKRLWQIAENKIIENVGKLSFPVSLKRKILDVIEPVGIEIRNWREFHGRFVCVTKLGESCLFWTQHGTVDKTKTAEALVKNDGLCIPGRYKLACIYCLESDVKMLWNKLPEVEKKLFYNKKEPQDVKQPELVVFWTYYINGEMAMLDKTFGTIAPYRYPFMCAIKSGNRTATEYFLQKLIPAERIHYLLASIQLCFNHSATKKFTDFSESCYSDVLCFILSQMGKEYQIRVFKRHSYEVLKCFLDCPWKSIYMEVAERVFPFITEVCYYNILWDIDCKLSDSNNDCKYLKFLGELWKQSPNNCKMYVIDEELKDGDMFILCNILKTQDMENIVFILNLIPVKRETLIFSYSGITMCIFLILKGSWNLVMFIVSECISSKEKIAKLKEEINIFLPCFLPEYKTAERENAYIFFNLLDDFIHKFGRKRSMEEETSNLTKKFSF